MKATEALVRLEGLGSSQWGLVTTAQALNEGISRLQLSRMTQCGVLHRLRQGVYALPSASHGRLQDLHAAWLLTAPAKEAEERGLSDEVVVSHHSAAEIHGLGNVVAARHEFSAVERRQSSRDDVRFHRSVVPASDRVLKDGLPVTSIARTVLDLADSALDFEHLALVVRDALSTPGVKYETLADRLDSVAARNGFATGRELVDAGLEEAGLPEAVTGLLHGGSTALKTAFSAHLEEMTRTLTRPFPRPSAASSR